MAESPEASAYRYAVSARTVDGREVAVTFGPVEGALTYAEYWTGPGPWWKRTWRRAQAALASRKESDA